MGRFLVCLRIFLILTLLTGVVYPLLVTLFTQILFPQQAQGLRLERQGVVIGSKLIAQKFQGEKYFWPRPSAVDYNPMSSGGSNLAPTSADLKKAFDERRAHLLQANPEQGEPPQDLLFASGSGLDPEISPESAHFQAVRVARARGLDPEKILRLIQKHTKDRQWNIFGEPRVNVLQLNLALEEEEGKAP